MNTPVWRLLDPVASSYLLFYNQNFIIGTQTGFSFWGGFFYYYYYYYLEEKKRKIFAFKLLGLGSIVFVLINADTTIRKMKKRGQLP
jgi:hypothetical protein